MPLTTLPYVKSLLNIVTSFDDAWVDALRDAAEVTIKEYLGREIERQVYTEYYHGTGTKFLTLRQRPVTPVSRTGTTTSGSAVITGLSSTTDLLAGMSVTGTGIPDGTTVSSLTATTATLSAAATASGTVTLTFGLAAWVDFSGYYGKNPSGAFASTTALVYGTDFVLDYDLGGTLSRSGLLVRINNHWLEETQVRRSGNLLVDRGPSLGSIKVAYAAGYQTIPKDIQAAVAYTVAAMKRTMPQGGELQSERIGAYSYELSQFTPKYPELGTARQLLSRYKEVAI